MYTPAEQPGGSRPVLFWIYGGGLNEGDLVRPRAEFEALCQKPMDYLGWSLDDIMTRISDLLTRYWVNFAASGAPNGGGLPQWPPYTAGTPLTMHVGDGGCKAEQIVLTGDEQRVLDYTKAHPGMLCSLEGFFEIE